VHTIITVTNENKKQTSNTRFQDHMPVHSIIQFQLDQQLEDAHRGYASSKLR